MIRLLTLKRICNLLKVWSSYQLSRWLGKTVVWGMPFSASIEPTTSCNLGCPECPSGLRSFTRATGNLSMESYEKYINAMGPELMYVILYFQGEPMLNKHFINMIRFAKSKKIYTATSTNAHFITKDLALETVKSGLDRLIVSIDGTTQEVYEQYRIYGNLEKVLEGTRNILEAKKQLQSSTPHVIFQFLVVKPNEHQIEEVKRLGKELGVDEVRLKSAQIDDFENGSELIPTQDRYSRYAKLPDGTYRIKNQMPNHCWRLWSSTVVTWDGKTVPCCFDKDAKYELGRLNERTMDEIWKGQDYQEFRKKIISGRKNVDICTNCTEGMGVWK